MTDVDIRVRPLTDRTAFTGPPLQGDRNPFNATWVNTRDLLDRELYYLDAQHVVMELDVAERDIRNDGQLRADVRVKGPGVRLAFDSMHGPLVYATDRYGWTYSDTYYVDGWRQNVRAIALGLEALRKVDRYGITRRAEQYRGFKAIGSGGLVATSMSVDVAWAIVAEESDTPIAAGLPREQQRHSIRLAKANAHPDRHNGDRTRYDAVDQAVQALQRAAQID